ncbi:rod shape-determining protein MreC [Agaribacter marinus]|uniref:Cell shape-determining protein MreC n=1 Tax=Agaribacter marinus TaxID=1431249 RepID=A0AA37SZX0_9ALTE|nr:rod shape-determining protein MreC [Agaribacter marinus]GLR72247.1 cell shape-determining protein MreC [Agaribacter marinus]
MNEVFPRGPSLLTRFILILVFSIIAMIVDTKVDSVKTLRTYLTSFVSPLQYIADMPGEVLNWSASRFTSRQNMLEENELLTSQITLLNGELQRLAALQQENNNLRNLLDAPVRVDMHKMIAELMSIDNNPYSHQIVINKGTLNDVYLGQAILDDNGIVGQVVEVGTTNSRVLLISDVTHAIPIRISRNNVRLVASGTGTLNELKLQHVPHSAEIREGDLLISSGLGNVFPEGYPVGIIDKIVSDESQPFAEVSVKPAARLDRLKYLLLLWPEDIAPEEAVASSDLYQQLESQDAR